MFRFFLAVYLTGASLSLAHARSGNSAPVPQEAGKIIINAEEIHYITEDNTSKAIGNAHAEKGEGPEKQVLTADEFTVYFKDQSKSMSSSVTTESKQDIESIAARGKVVMVKGDLVIKADECVYSSEIARDPKKADQIDCYKNVSIKKAGHYIEGNIGTVNLRTGIYTVKNSADSKKKSVKALIQPSLAKTGT